MATVVRSIEPPQKARGTSTSQGQSLDAHDRGTAAKVPNGEKSSAHVKFPKP